MRGVIRKYSRQKSGRGEYIEQVRTDNATKNIVVFLNWVFVPG